MKIQNLLLTTSLLISTSAYASTLKVTTGEDSVAGSLRAAVAAAQDGDTVEIDSSVKRVAIKEGHILLTKSLMITSNARTKEGRPTIDGLGKNRIFLAVGRNLNIELSNLKFTNAKTYQKPFVNMEVKGHTYAIPQAEGAVMLLVGPSNNLNIHHVEILENRAVGGVITNSNDPTIQPWTKVTIQNSEFRNNRSENRGGAINTFWTNLKLSGVFFASNSAFEGGAIYNNAGCVAAKNTTFANNSAVENGGAIANFGALRLVNSNIGSNSARSGGGIHAGYITQIKRTNIQNNTGGDADKIYNLISEGDNKIATFTSELTPNAIKFQATDLVNGRYNPVHLNREGQFAPGFPPCAFEEI